jgi:predicted metal-dependent RNase
MYGGENLRLLNIILSAFLPGMFKLRVRCPINITPPTLYLLGSLVAQEYSALCKQGGMAWL